MGNADTPNTDRIYSAYLAYCGYKGLDSSSSHTVSNLGTMLAELLALCAEHDVEPPNDPDVIAIKWHTEDVMSRRIDLTEDECRDVLQRLKDSHDATVGISWETIDVVAECHYPDKTVGDKFIRVRGVDYPYIDINDDEGEEQRYSVDSLNDVLSPLVDSGDENAEALDNDIRFYVPDDVFAKHINYGGCVDVAGLWEYIKANCD
jgi:hypothetical protein